MDKEVKEKADELVRVFRSIQLTDYQDGKPFNTRTMEEVMAKAAASTCVEAIIRESKNHNPERVEFWVKVKHYIG